MVSTHARQIWLFPQGENKKMKPPPSYSKLNRIFTKTWVTHLQVGVEKAPGHPAAFRQPSLFLLVPGKATQRQSWHASKNGIFRRHTPRWISNMDVFWIDVFFCVEKNDWMSRKHVQFNHHQPQGLGWWINTDSLHCTIFHINLEILKTNSTGLPPSIENKTSLKIDQRNSA